MFKTIDVNDLKNYYKNTYVLPTFDSVSRFAKNDSTLKRSESIMKNNDESRLIFPEIKVVETHHKGLIYPTRSISRLVLKINSEVHKQIYESIQKESNNLKKMLLEKYKRSIEPIKNMPIIKKYHIDTQKKAYKEIVKFVPLQSNSPCTLKNSKNQAKLNTNVNITFSFIWSFYESDLWSPEVREGATLSSIGNTAYLFGGLGRQLFNIMCVLKRETNHYPECLKQVGYSWSTYDVSPMQLDRFPKPRYGHSASIFENDIVVFGGVRLYNKVAKTRECLNDLQVFHSRTEEWEELKCGGICIEPRRNHASCKIGNTLLIHGGIDLHGKYLNDLEVISLNTTKKSKGSLKWLNINTIGERKEVVSYHTCCLVLNKEKFNNPNLNFFRIPDLNNTEKGRVCEEGVYFFGGRDEYGNVYNKIQILKIGRNTPEWITPEIAGIPPLPRYGHTMNYYPQSQIIIIFGGRNDQNFFSQGSLNLNDVCILSVADKLTWANVNLSGKIPKGRYSHCSTIMDDKLIIFAGISDCSLSGSEIAEMELNQIEISKIKNEELIQKNLNNSQIGKLIDSISKIQ